MDFDIIFDYILFEPDPKDFPFTVYFKNYKDYGVDEIHTWLASNIDKTGKTWKLTYVVFNGLNVSFKNQNDLMLFELTWM